MPSHSVLTLSVSAISFTGIKLPWLCQRSWMEACFQLSTTSRGSTEGGRLGPTNESGGNRDGIRLIREGPREHIGLVIDSLEFASLWKNLGKHRSEFTAIIDDVQELVPAFSSIRVLHTKRSANFETHLCPQHASAAMQNFVWLTPPSFLQLCLQSNSNDFI